MNEYEPRTGRSIWDLCGCTREEFYGHARRFVEEVKTLQTADALKGDDRPADSGDDFETRMLKLMQL